MTDAPTVRQRLRALRALAGAPPAFDPDAAPDDPAELFVDWLVAAIDAGVAEPHVMSVATADETGTPSSRVVVLADVVDGAWWFATDARSRKGRDLVVNPRVELGFWWPPVARQVRVTGVARLLEPSSTAADFLARSPSSRSAAFATRPGEPLRDVGALAESMAQAAAAVEQDPDRVLAEWQVWLVEPHEIEFWQGDPTRAHVRLVYRREGATWSRGLVWP